MASAQVEVLITFCGGWGYGSRFRRIAQEITAEFGAAVKVHGRTTPGISGALEVEIVGGPKLHSKLGGGGYVDSAAKMDRILQGIRDYIAAKGK